MSEIKVNSIKGVGASAAAITVNNTDGTCTANITNNLSNRNLIINGAMQVAQRGTSSTSVGYQTVDRMYVGFAGTDEAPTITQADISSSDTPYTKGFRKALKIQNGNQTSGAGAADEMTFVYNIEAQDLAQSGWDYTSSSSNISISFWVKSSVAQQFQVNNRLYGPSGGNQREFCYEYTLAANTWTKITKTIPGQADNTLRNTNELGMFMMFGLFYGTNYTASGRTFDQWGAKNNAANFRDFATTWYTTNDATFEITGVQLEVGSVATDFEHRSFGQELALCKRYYNRFTAGSAYTRFADGQVQSTDQAEFTFQHPVTMRAAPTFGYGGSVKGWSENALKTVSSIALNDPNVNNCTFTATTSGCTRGTAIDFLANNSSTAYIEFISEL